VLLETPGRPHARKLALPIAERDETIRAIGRPSDGLAELRSVLAERVWRLIDVRVP
jgi:hypothetical protein